MDKVSPDAVMLSDGNTVEVSDDPLSPCPSCGASSVDAPEGVKADGTAVWQNDHCHKCGFRPGHNVSSNLHKMRQEFAAFVDWNNRKMADLAADPTAKGINPPANSAEVEALQRALADALDQNVQLQAAQAASVVSDKANEPTNTALTTPPQGS